MRGLFDTHAFIWWDSHPSRLSSRVLAFLHDPANTLLLSAASIWEIVIKVQLGRLTLTTPLAEIISQQTANGIEILPITVEHVLGIQSLPSIHKDPFDRALIAQAQIEHAVLLSADATVASYPVSVLW